MTHGWYALKEELLIHEKKASLPTIEAKKNSLCNYWFI